MTHDEAIQQAVTAGELSASAAANINLWLNGQKYHEYHDDIKRMIDHKNWQELDDNFWQIIPFGTGGRRGTVGVGSNRINRVTMGESAQGFADYLAEAVPNAREKGVVIAYDTRLTSVEFSQFVATVFAANAYKVFLFDGFRATPELSFAVRHLGAAAGVVVSASHNPVHDNGFKAYWSDGGQIVPPHDTNIIDIASSVEEISTVDFDEAVANDQIAIVGSELDEAYIKAIVEESLLSSRSAAVVYSPLHGTGQVSVLPVLQAAGFKEVTTAETQMEPDGHFPNVANNIPNPELPETAEQVTASAQEYQADFALTTDPDADRLGVIAKDDDGDYTFLTGNQIAALIGYFVLSQMKEQGKLTEKHFLAKTIVTTDFLDVMAEDFGVEIFNNILIGFKYIGELIRLHEDEGDKLFLFGGEESHGILKGSYTRDKDAAIAALLIAEQVSYLKDQNKTLVGQLNDLYRKYGLYWETLVSVFYEGAEGGNKMNAIMKGLREAPPTELGSLSVLTVIDRLEEKNGPVGDVLVFNLSENGRSRITVRPSGTEPKIKFYTQLHEPTADDLSDPELAEKKRAIDARANEITQSLVDYTESLV